MNRRLLTIDLVLKAALVLLLLHAVVFPDLPQYQGKGIGWRLLYPISSILVPLVWSSCAAAEGRAATIRISSISASDCRS